jgi:hypothetical protein
MADDLEPQEVMMLSRTKGEIGDNAFHRIEAELDVAKLNALGAEFKRRRV